MTVYTLRGKSAHYSSTRYNLPIICCVIILSNRARTPRCFARSNFSRKWNLIHFFLNFNLSSGIATFFDFLIKYWNDQNCRCNYSAGLSPKDFHSCAITTPEVTALSCGWLPSHRRIKLTWPHVSVEYNSR